MENFIKLQINKDYTLYQNVIISYLQSFQENNKYYYAGVKELSSILNIPISSLNNSINDLIKKKVIFKSKDKKHIQHTFNNRSAIVLVDKNNPYPTNDTSNIKPNEVKTKNNTNIPQEEIKDVTDEKSQLQKLLEQEIEELDKERELTNEELDKILTEGQNGVFYPTEKKQKEIKISPDYQTTIISNQGIEMKIDDDLVEYYNTKIKHKTGYIKNHLKSKSEYIMNMNLRDKMNSEIY